jgi:hypothetical protein
MSIILSHVLFKFTFEYLKKFTCSYKNHLQDLLVLKIKRVPEKEKKKKKREREVINKQKKLNLNFLSNLLFLIKRYLIKCLYKKMPSDQMPLEQMLIITNVK